MKFSKLRVSLRFSKLAGYRSSVESLPPMIVRHTYAVNYACSSSYPLPDWLDRLVRGARFEIYETDY